MRVAVSFRQTFKILLTIIYSLYGITGYGQEYDKKKLLSELSNKPSQKREVTLLWNLADEMQRYNSDSALILGYRVISLSKSINYQEGLSRSLGITANVYSRMGNYPKAMELYLEK